MRELDRRVRASERGAAAARVLAGAADRDVTEMGGKLDAAAAGQQQIVDILQRLIANQG